MFGPQHRGRDGEPVRAEAGACSAADVATVPEPARYQPMDAVNAPGEPYPPTR